MSWQSALSCTGSMMRRCAPDAPRVASCTSIDAVLLANYTMLAAAVQQIPLVVTLHNARLCADSDSSQNDVKLAELEAAVSSAPTELLLAKTGMQGGNSGTDLWSQPTAQSLESRAPPRPEPDGRHWVSLPFQKATLKSILWFSIAWTCLSLPKPQYQMLLQGPDVSQRNWLGVSNEGAPEEMAAVLTEDVRSSD